jgi:hypothetical protein
MVWGWRSPPPPPPRRAPCRAPRTTSSSASSKRGHHDDASTADQPKDLRTRRRGRLALLAYPSTRRRSARRVGSCLGCRCFGAGCALCSGSTAWRCCESAGGTVARAAVAAVAAVAAFFEGASRTILLCARAPVASALRPCSTWSMMATTWSRHVVPLCHRRHRGVHARTMRDARCTAHVSSPPSPAMPSHSSLPRSARNERLPQAMRGCPRPPLVEAMRCSAARLAMGSAASFGVWLPECSVASQARRS